MEKAHRFYPYYFKDEDRTKRVGLLRDDLKVFLKIVTPAHYFRKFKGFSISKKVFDDLKKKGVVQIRIVYLDKEKGVRKTYKTSIYAWEQEGIKYVNDNNPKDLQLVMPVEKMVESNAYQTKFISYHCGGGGK